jgi:FimV-like protein
MDNPKQNYAICILLAFMLSLLPEIGFSLGFGPIKLSSYLNEPLDAEIELQGAEDIDTSHLIATLASVEDFKHIELARPYFLSTLRFEVVQKNKQTILKVTSDEVVKQPYLEFLVQFTWPEGRLVRDYTLLLDPETFAEVSKRSANEQAPQMLNKTDDLEESVSSESSVPFQDSAAILALQEKSTQVENTIPPTAIAEAKSALGTNDTFAGVVVDKPIQKWTSEIQSKPTIESLQLTPAIQSTSTFSQKQILLGSGLTLFLIVALTAWFLRRKRSRVQLSSHRGINILEDIEIFDEELKLKLDLASQYIAYQDIQNAKAILEEIISRGNSEEIKAAKGMLKKCQ